MTKSMLILLIALAPVAAIFAQTPEFGISDDQGVYCYGNNDGVVDSFEIVAVYGNWQCSAPLSGPGPWQLVPEVPEGVTVVRPPQLSVSANRRQVKFIFSLVASERFHGEILPVWVHIHDHHGRRRESRLLNAPFRRSDLAQRYLSGGFDCHDKHQLDQFLDKFAESEVAPVMLRLRLECCRDVVHPVLSGGNDRELRLAIGEYDEFIARYPDRLLTFTALNEAFQLYCRLDDVGFYRRFIERYPDSEYSLIANQRILDRHYRDAVSANTVAVYDTFIQLHPEPSWYYLNCLKKAYALDLAQERELCRKFETLPEPQREKAIDKRVEELLYQLLKIMRSYKELPQAHRRVEMMQNNHRARRIKAVLYEVYARHKPGQLIALHIIDDLQKMHLELRDFIEAHQQKLLAEIDRRFKNLNERLDHDFARVIADIQLLRSDVAELRREMRANFRQLRHEIGQLRLQVTAMHRDLAGRLDQLSSELDDVKQRMRMLEDGVAKVHRTLVNSMPSYPVPRYLRNLIPKVLLSAKKLIYSGYQKIRQAVTGVKPRTFQHRVYYLTDRLRSDDRYVNQQAKAATAHRGLVVVDHRENYREIPLKRPFYQELNQALAKAKRRELLIYIHGFTASFRDAVYCAGRLAEDSRYPGVVLAYSWPSWEKMLNYPDDKERAIWSGPRLARALGELAANCHADSISLLAHSMGNLVFSQAVGELVTNSKLCFKHLILHAADLDARTFRDHLAAKYRRCAGHITIYASRKDMALALSRRLQSNLRVGAVDDTGPAVVMSGIDTVDVSVTSTEYYHTHIRDLRVARDLCDLLLDAPAERRWLTRQTKPGRGYYWKLKESESPQPWPTILPKLRIDDKQPGKPPAKPVIAPPSRKVLRTIIAATKSEQRVSLRPGEWQVTIEITPGDCGPAHPQPIRIERQLAPGQKAEVAWQATINGQNCSFVGMHLAFDADGVPRLIGTLRMGNPNAGPQPQDHKIDADLRLPWQSEYPPLALAVDSALLPDYGLPWQLWHKCRYLHRSQWLLDMTTPEWQALTSAQRREYSAAYQRGYAAARGLPVEKIHAAASAAVTMRLIPPGRFWMGSPESELGRYANERRHRVVIEQPFWLQKTELTRMSWKRIVATAPWQQDKLYIDSDDRHPAVYISWEDIHHKLLPKLKGYGLPSEAQWEYACRAGETGRFFWGDDAQAIAGYANIRDRASHKRFRLSGCLNHDDGFAAFAPVGQFRPNAFGLHDMIGNAWEWCQDRYAEYSDQATAKPVISGKERVRRGGSWSDAKLEWLRSAQRSRVADDHRRNFIGVRLVRTAELPVATDD